MYKKSPSYRTMLLREVSVDWIKEGETSRENVKKESLHQLQDSLHLGKPAD